MERDKMNIVIVGVGYVGLSNAILLAQKHHVTAVDILPEKIELINRKKLLLLIRKLENILRRRSLI